MPARNAPRASQPATASTAKRPVQSLRLGRIKASIWENPVESKMFYNVTFIRTYRDDAGTFHDTESFGRDDLPLVAKLADQAHTFIFARLSKQKPETEPENE